MFRAHSINSNYIFVLDRANSNSYITRKSIFPRFFFCKMLDHNMLKAQTLTADDDMMTRNIYIEHKNQNIITR